MSTSYFTWKLCSVCCLKLLPQFNSVLWHIFPQWLAWLTDSTVLAARMSLWRKMAQGRCGQLAMLMALSLAPRSSRLRKSLRWALQI